MSKQFPPIFFDEFPSVWNNPRSDIIRRVSKIKEIGSSSFQVVGDKVFVLNKLIDLINKVEISDTEVLKLATKAIIDIEVAVSEYKLKPSQVEINRNYDKQANKELLFINSTRVEDAIVPIMYSSRAEIDAAFSRLLKGEFLKVPARDRQFKIGGQVFELNATLYFPSPEDLSYITSLPNSSNILDIAKFSKDFDHKKLYVEGLTTPAEIESLAYGQNMIDAINSAATDFFERNKSIAWHGVMNVDLEDHKNHFEYPLSGEEDNKAMLLEELYPELFELGKVALYRLYEYFMINYSTEDDDPVRMTKFIFYTLGALFIDPNDDDTCVQYGRLFLYANIHGLDQLQANEWAKNIIESASSIDKTRKTLIDIINAAKTPISDIQYNTTFPIIINRNDSRNTDPVTPFIRHLVAKMNDDSEPSL